ncbi:MAG: SGNH/GDSL hydrolase family protein [Bacteroides sp.]
MNYLKHSLWLTLLLLVVLLLLHWLPAPTIDEYTLRRVDLLNDVRPLQPEVEDVLPDSLLPKVEKPQFVDTCRTGMTCIEDYSDSTCRGLSSFYEALNRIESEDRLVRIAVFGDSFIEADIFTADLRELLQRKFGGCGVGFVNVTTMTSGYRPTVRHKYAGWNSHALTDSTRFDRQKLGVSGYYFLSQPGAYVELRGQKNYGSRLDTCQRASIFFQNKGAVSLSVCVNGGETKTEEFAPSGTLQQMQVKGRIGSVRWDVIQADSTLFYGMAMDGDKGIIVDNFSLRGSSGLSIRSIPVERMEAFNELRPYDFIILQYGLNVATVHGRNYDYYQKGLLATIDRLKKSFPRAGFLLLSVGDRDFKTDTGELRTMPGVKNLIRYQQSIASESHIAFWNLFEAMGGEGSMARMVHAKPSMGNYDYTHINFRGGKHLAGLLYESLIYGKEQQEKRQRYEEK